MDKPRHPQVIRPWIQPRQKSGFQRPGKPEVRHTHEGKNRTQQFRFKTPGE